MVELTRDEYNLIAERRGIKKPQNMSTKNYQILLIGMISAVKLVNYQK